MGKILSPTAIAPNTSFTVPKDLQQAFNALRFSATGSVAAGWQPNDLTVTASLKNRSNAVLVLIQGLDLYTLSRLRDDDDGGYSIFNLGGAATANIDLQITLGYLGSNIFLDQNLYVELTINNNSATVTYTLNIDSIEAATTRPAYMRYERVNFSAATAATDQYMSVADADKIWVPQTATPWQQLRIESPSRSTLVLQDIAALRPFKYKDDSIVATDSAGANPLYAASLPAALDGAVIDVIGYSQLTMIYANNQSVTKRAPQLNLLTDSNSPVFDPQVAARVAQLMRAA
jgi:hypothetical protein